MRHDPCALVAAAEVSAALGESVEAGQKKPIAQKVAAKAT
jgi:hypothetical protein